MTCNLTKRRYKQHPRHRRHGQLATHQTSTSFNFHHRATLPHFAGNCLRTIETTNQIILSPTILVLLENENMPKHCTLKINLPEKEPLQHLFMIVDFLFLHMSFSFVGDLSSAYQKHVPYLQSWIEPRIPNQTLSL
jgi:hypothetical protein